MLRKQKDVCPPLAKWRDLNPNDVQAVKQVLPKAAFFNSGAEAVENAVGKGKRIVS